MVASVGTLALAAYFKNARTPLAVTSAALLARATTGYCPVTAALNGSANGQTQQALAGARGVHLASAITIAAKPAAVYAFWRDPAQLAQALPPNITVHAQDDSHWHWSLGTAETPDLATWTSELINDVPSKVLSWKTVGESTIVSAGSVSFSKAPGGRGTEVRVRMQYSPPMGRLGAAVARLFGQSADEIVRQSLRDIKHYLEGDPRHD